MSARNRLAPGETEREDKERTSDLRSRAVRGVPWTIVSYAGTKAIGVATTLVLARLLVPSDFGLVALAQLAIGVMALLSGFGLGGVLVVRRDLGKSGEGTVLTLLLGLGVAFSALLAASSPFVARIFAQPRLEAVLLALAAMVFFSGVNWFYETLLLRELAFRRRFVAVVIPTFVNTAVAVPLAALGAGVWSLVGGVIASSFTNSVMMFTLAPYRVRPSFDRRVAREAISSGSGFLLQSANAFVQQNVDYFSIGRILGTAPLGFYSMAYRLGELPYWVIADPVLKVTFPTFSRMHHEGEEVSSPYLLSLRLIALVACPTGAILSATSTPFVHVVLGARWAPAIGPLSALGIWAAIKPLEAASGWLLNSLGHARAAGLIYTVLLVPHVPAVVLAAYLGGTTAVAWVMVVHMAFAFAAYVIVAHRRAGISIAAHLGALRPALVGSAGAWVVARVSADALDSSPALAVFTAPAAAVATYVGIVWVIQPELPKLALHYVAAAVRRTPPRAAP